MPSPSSSAMSSTALRSNGALAVGDGDNRELVLEQLERILASPVFRNSKRYTAVLRYIVERTLNGNGEQLKERTIGVDVFGREPDYDTASDHAVRSAMAEIRKRLAQYYQEDGHGCELRFEVQPGSYVPQFRVAAMSPDRVPGVLSGQDNPPVPVDRAGTLRRRWFAGILVGGLAAGGAVLALRLPGRDAETRFWEPVLASPNQVLLCVGNLEGGRGPDLNGERSDPRALTMSDFHRLSSQTVHISDTVALARLAGFLQSRGKSWRIATQSEAGLRDLGTGPAILIGLMNNDWTGRLVGKLRFRVERPAPRKVVIRDNQDPSRDDWSMDYSTPLLNVTKDYALVLRVLDPKTDQMVVAAAGISVFGTLAAAEFLTSERELRSLETWAPGGWQHKNFEIVLATEVVRAQSGRPRIVAAHIW